MAAVRARTADHSLPPSNRVQHTAAPAEILKNLSEAVRQIQQHNASKLSFEEQYRHAYNLVTTSQGHTLYNTVADLVSAHLEKEALDRIVPAFPPSTSSVTLASGSGNGAANIAAAAAAQIFLGRLVAVWGDHLMCMGKLRDVLKYMVSPCVRLIPWTRSD
jgi:cullin 3